MFEMLVALNVTDQEVYKRYRDAMTPILTEYKGSFGYDFKVSEVLISEVKDTMNRVFTIRFPNKEIMDKFFSDSRYLAVKEQYFSQSVSETNIIASYFQ